MSIQKRPDSDLWWIDISTPSGKRIRRSTGTKNRKAAQELHDRLRAQLWRQDMLGEAPDRTFEEAAVRFLRASEGQRDYGTKVRHVAYWRDQFAGWAVGSLTTEAIMDALPTHRTFKKKGSVKLAPATRNRHLATIRRILSLCEEWRWIIKAPKLRPQGEPKVRIRWLTDADAHAFLAAINKDWLRDACAFALATGMRAGEILSLEWSDIDLSRKQAWITADKAKSSYARSVPLNDDAVAIIERRQGSHPRYAFTRNGKTQTVIDPKMVSSASRRAGLVNLRFHDLRHTWASWHAQAGTPLFVLKELGGWETLEMVKKYAHLNAGHLAEYANNVTFTSRSAPETKTPPCRVALVA